jgi:hypothetical protein
MQPRKDDPNAGKKRRKGRQEKAGRQEKTQWQKAGKAQHNNRLDRKGAK